MKKALHIIIVLAGMLTSFSAFAQPANDGCATAQSITPDGTCVNGTTVGAADNWTGTVGCQGGAGNGHEDVWYSFVATGSNFTSTVTTSGAWTGNVEFVLVSGTCAGTMTLVTSGCGASPLTVTATGLSIGTTYFFTVSNTATGANGPFQVCTTTSSPAASCTDNDDCNSPTTITYTTGVQTCLTDCNTGAAPGPDFTGNNCYDYPQETVWYEVTTGAASAILDITLTSTDLTTPYFSVFTTNDCLNYTIINCTQGAAGSATQQVTVSPNTTYLIAISDGGGLTGNFNLCVTVEDDNSACNTNDQITVTATSMGSPLTGPFQPGEIVTFCYTITDWQTTPSCQYLQGIVPTFGDCWDPVSFNAQGRPQTITTALTTAGTIQPCGPGPPCAWNACANTSAGTWSWFPAGSVNYNFNGYHPAGTALGAGWFFLTSYNPATGACTGDPTDPDNSYGDNNFPNCTNTLDWQVCFQLQARSAVACTNGQTDCSVSIRTYADGEIGSYNDVGCSADIPSTFSTILSCCVPPVATAGTDATICSGGSTTIGAAAAAGMTYNWNPSTGLSSATAANPTVTLTNAGTTPTVVQFVVTQTETASGCADTDTVLVTVNPIPSVTSTPASQTICSGATTSLNLTSGVAGATFSWTAAGSAGTIGGYSDNSGSSIAQTLTNTATTSGTVTYSVTATANGCSSTVTPVVVTVNPIPSATATPATATICSGATTAVNLTSTVAGTTFAWTATGSAGTIGGFSNGTGNSIAQTLTNTGTTSGTVTYTVTPTAGTCAGTAIQVVITVNPIPAATATPATATICSGATTAVNLTSTVAGTTFAWTATGSAGTIGGFSNGTGNSIAQTLTNSGTTSGTVTYTITPTAGTCAGTAIQAVITVNPIPSATATPATATICSGATTAVNLTSNVAGTTFTWIAAGSAGTIGGYSNSSGNSIAQTLTNSGTTSGTVTYTVTPTAGTCAGSTIPVVITVNPVPAATATPATATICSGATTAVNLTSTVAGTTFAWTATGSAGTIGGFSNGTGNSIAQTLTNTGTTSGTVTYTVTPTAGTCAGTAIQVVITVNPIPAATATPATATICSGATTAVNLTSTVAGTTFAWTATGSAGTIGGFSNGTGNSIAQTLTNSGTTSGTVTYTVTPTAGTCAGTAIQAVITVNPIPSATATPATATICSGATTAVNLTSTVAGTTFTWTAAGSAGTIGGYSNSSGNSIAQTLTNSGTTSGTVTYTVTPTAGTCAGSTIPVVITVNPVPAATATPATATLCSGATTAVNLTSTVAGTTFAWIATGSAGTIGGFSNGTGNSIAQTLTNTGTTSGTVTYTVTPTAGTCAGTAIQVVITVNPIPAATATPATATICSGATTAVNLTSTVAGTTFAWTATGSAGTITGFSNGTGNSIAQTLTNSGATGTVTYTITPTAGTCAGSTIQAVITVTGMSVSTSTTNTNCGVSTGTATATPSGGTANYTYSWSTTPVQTTPTATDLPAGPVNVTVTDANGCTASAVASVNSNNAPSVSITSTTDVLCNGAATGSATASASGGTGALTYTWNTVPAQTGQTATNLAAGSYVVTVNDAASCSASITAVISEPTALTTTIASTNVTCNGLSNGTATATPSGGTGTYTYSWSTTPVQTTATANNLAAGTYLLDIRDANNCLLDTSVVITEPLAVSVSITATTNVSCNGGTNGSATASASGGTGTLVYSWSTTPSVSTPTAGNLAAGTYSVTVTDDNLCTATTDTIITEPALLVINATAVNASCAGNDGQITLTANGGTSPYEFSNDNGATYQASGGFTALPAGTYFVWVRDNNLCTDSATVTISSGGTLNASVSASTNATCNATCDGTATVTATGGTANYTYSWSTTPSITTPSATGLCAGTYTISVTEASSTPAETLLFEDFEGVPAWTLNVSTGTNDADANIWVISDNEPGILPPGCGITIPNGDNTLHITSTFNPTGGAAYNSGGICPVMCVTTNSRAESPAISTIGKTNLSLSFDFISMGDALIDNASVWYNAGSGWTQLSNSIKSVNCGSGQGQWTAFTNPLPAACENVPSLQVGINWTNNDDALGSDPSVAINNVRIIAAPVIGSVCLDTTTVIITEPTAITATTDSVPASCGVSNGSATVTASGGTGVLTYSWNTVPSQSTPTATGLSSGTYQVSVTDENNCSITATAIVTTPSGLSVNIIDTVNVGCFGASTGGATASAIGGSGSFTYSWTPGGDTDSVLTNVPAGTYTVTVTDAALCTATNTVTITEPPVLNVTSGFIDVTCNGGSNGSAGLTVSGGTTPYTYSWNNGSVNDTITAITAGTYNYTVTDSNNCVSQGQVIISEPAVLSLTVNTVDPLCFNDVNGSAAVATLTGGTGAYTYSWSNGVLNDSISNVGAGQYTLTVTDANNCTVSQMVELFNPAAITATVSSTNVACFGGNTGSASATNAAGGTGVLSYSWNTVPVQTTSSISNLSAGSYTVTITDENNCIFTQPVTVTEPASAVSATATGSPSSCANSANGSALATVNGGTTPYTYSWSNGSTTINATPLQSGTYTFAVTDANGCTATDTAEVTSPSAITFSTTSLTASCGNNDGEATVSSSGGTGAHSYSWIGTSVTSSILNGVGAGNYDVIITDLNGCSDTATVNVQQDAAPVASFTATPTEGMFPLVVSFNNTSTNADIYLWNFGNGITDGINLNPTATYSNQGEYIAYLTVSSGSCVDSMAVTIKVLGPSAFEVPNVFTPDGDFQNDVFSMIATNLTDMKMQIFNRWGEKLFDQQGANVYWDGNTPSGVQAPAGTYYYIISATGADGKSYGPLTGFILLNRK